MSTQTPEPPPTPVALALSPALWQLNLPDRFDSYSAGVTLLQMCLPTLRSDNNLIAFRKKLEDNGESLSQWRSELPPRWFAGADGEGFEVLDKIRAVATGSSNGHQDDDAPGWQFTQPAGGSEGAAPLGSGHDTGPRIDPLAMRDNPELGHEGAPGWQFTRPRGSSGDG